MSARNKGGPAFPVPAVMTQGNRMLHSAEDFRGMTLRDYFAAKAMHAHLITDTVPGEAADALLEAAERAGRDPLDHLCINAYEVADAMLRAREGAQ